MMAPIPTEGLDKADAKAFSAQVHDIMSAKFNEINREAATLIGKTIPADDV